MRTPKSPFTPAFVVALSILALPRISEAGEVAVPREAPMLVSAQGAEHHNNWPEVALDENGVTHLVWTQSSPLGGSLDGSGPAIAYRGIEADGTLSLGPIHINTYTWNEQTNAQIDARPGGGYSATWTSRGDGAGDGSWSVFRDNLKVNVQTDYRQDLSDVAVSSSGQTFVVWRSEHLEIYSGEIFGDFGTGYDVRIGSDEFTGSTRPRVAVRDGNVGVAWQRSGGEVVLRVLSPNGSPVGSEQVLCNGEASQRSLAEITALSAGGFLVVAEGKMPGSNAPRILGQTFDALGVPTSGCIDIASTSGNVYSHPHVASDPNGRAVVVWRWGNHIQGRLLDPATLGLGSVFDVDPGPPPLFEGYHRPTVSMGEADEFVVAFQWDKKYDEIWARRYDIVDDGL